MSVDPMTGEPIEPEAPSSTQDRSEGRSKGIDDMAEAELEVAQDEGADATETEPGAVVTAVFMDLAGLPGWGSDPKPDDPDTSTIVARHAGPAGGEIRVVRGCTVLTSFDDPRVAVRATLALLAEAQRSSGSAVAGAHLEIGDPSDVGPQARVARVAASLAGLADADKLLVTAQMVEALEATGSDLAFDDGPHADVDGERVSTFVVRRR
jgi:hypothetical protein